jgi:glycosyltransferase involved in cell wall biosynthesis
MAEQLKRFGIFRLATIGNFVDENNLESQRQPYGKHSGSFRFILLGRLTPLKRPELAIEAVYTLLKKGIDCQLDIVGHGPMLSELEAQVRRLELDSSVFFHGYMPNPFQILQAADCLVLPSRTEGISRAVIEALFFGVPAILRDVEASREVITPGVNGELFTGDNKIAEVMARTVEAPIRRLGSGTNNLLPLAFRQDANVERFLRLVLQ